MTPEEMQRRIKHMADEMEKAKRQSIVVGLPRGEATSKVYGNGVSVLRVGAVHEFGLGRVPERSFLRVPFMEKRNTVDDIMLKYWRQVAEGRMDADKAMSLAGVEFRNIVIDAFATNGFGNWPELDPATVAEKGSSGVLIDTGTLRNSITWKVR